MRHKLKSLYTIFIFSITVMGTSVYGTDPVEFYAVAKLVRGHVWVWGDRAPIKSGFKFSGLFVVTEANSSVIIDFGNYVVNLPSNSHFNFIEYGKYKNTLSYSWLRAKGKGIKLGFFLKERFFSIATKGTEFILSTGRTASSITLQKPNPILSGVYVKEGIVELTVEDQTIEIKSGEQITTDDMKLSPLNPNVLRMFDEEINKSNSNPNQQSSETNYSSERFPLSSSQKSHMKLFEAKQNIELIRLRLNGYRRGY
ncbi:MAG: hypothetical protein KDK90_24430 [Leptospiraceae bacterium]|nr:hypothetical protein [Leptospiraceae bacterium]